MKHKHSLIQHQLNQPLAMSGLGQVYQSLAQGLFTNSINNTIKKFNAIKAGTAAPSKSKVGTTALNRAKLQQALYPNKNYVATSNKAKQQKALSN